MDHTVGESEVAAGIDPRAGRTAGAEAAGHVDDDPSRSGEASTPTGATSRDGRFAPSPTGVLHVGNLRTALAAWLFARSAGARFIVRIEDLDPDRSRPELALAQLADLAAIGIDWDEEPVRQSERHDLYRRTLALLAEGDRTYPCFCTRAEIRGAASAPHGESVPRRGTDLQAFGPDGAYPGTCSRIAPSSARRRVEAGELHCVRVRAREEVIAFRDRLLGRVEAAVDDFVVCRKDAVAAYNLAVVVDDAAQRVGEVVRGADLASSTPRQLLVARLLGVAPPAYAHVGLVVGADGTRLAKRHGSVTLAQLAAAGRPAGEVRARLARSLGIEVEHGERPSMDDLVTRFDPACVPVEPVVFDLA